MNKLFKLISDNIDKFMMTLIFFVIFFSYLGLIIRGFDVSILGSLVRDAFLVLTALLGFRRQPPASDQPSGQTETGDVLVNPAPDPTKLAPPVVNPPE